MATCFHSNFFTSAAYPRHMTSSEGCRLNEYELYSFGSTSKWIRSSSSLNDLTYSWMRSSLGPIKANMLPFISLHTIQHNWELLGRNFFYYWFKNESITFFYCLNLFQAWYVYYFVQQSGMAGGLVQISQLELIRYVNSVFEHNLFIGLDAIIAAY